MAGSPAPLAAAQYAARAIAGHLAVPAEVRELGWRGGFSREFATADGQRVVVAALTRQQFTDLANATRLARTFAFLERVLYADFSSGGDLYAHRATIATLLAPWFARRTVADLTAAFTGTSVPWTRIT
ncbi:MAG: CoA transferase [Streptosporangiaceae bacterium]